MYAIRCYYVFRTLFKYCIYLAVFTAIIFGIVAYVGYRYYTYDLPDFQNDISGYRPKLINEVYSSEGLLLAEFYSENRRLVPLSEIPEHVIDAFVAVEDRRFYEHQGIDLMGIFAAFIANIKEGEIIRGGSTITRNNFV